MLNSLGDDLLSCLTSSLTSSDRAKVFHTSHMLETFVRIIAEFYKLDLNNLRNRNKLCVTFEYYLKRFKIRQNQLDLLDDCLVALFWSVLKTYQAVNGRRGKIGRRNRLRKADVLSYSNQYYCFERRITKIYLNRMAMVFNVAIFPTLDRLVEMKLPSIDIISYIGNETYPQYVYRYIYDKLNSFIIANGTVNSARAEQDIIRLVVSVVMVIIDDPEKVIKKLFPKSWCKTIQMEYLLKETNAVYTQ